MDAFNENLTLKIVDETIESQSTPDEGFVIDSDPKAEWALRKISEERAETQRYINVCRTMINEYQEKIRQAEERLNGRTSFLEGQLRNYFETVKFKVSRTQATYKLPSGTLKVKYPSPEFVRDDAQLVKWLKDNSMNEYIKLEEKADWSELKKKVKVSGEKVVTDDGVIVEGIKAVERSPVFEVEL